jgi:small-conductance mechanosensitive channel
MVFENSELLNSAVLGSLAFALSFVVLYILWSIVLRIAESFFSRSKLYFIPRLLKEIGRSVLFVILLVSVYFGIHFYDPALLDGTLIKVWGILLILVFTEIIARILLSTMDVYRAKLRGAPTFISNRIPLLKTLLGLFIYGVAILVVINYLSYEIGSVVTLIGVLFLIFIFVLSYEPVKNIVAGFQLPDRMQEGDLVEIAGNQGFVERVLDQYTIIRDMDGKSITVPNSQFVKSVMKNSFFSEGNLICLNVKIKGNSKEKLTGVCGKVALKLEEVFNDYNPKVHLSGVKDGTSIYNVKFIVLPNADLRKIIDTFTMAIRKEFKNNLIGIGME